MSSFGIHRRLHTFIYLFIIYLLQSPDCCHVKSLCSLCHTDHICKHCSDCCPGGTAMSGRSCQVAQFGWRTRFIIFSMKSPVILFPNDGVYCHLEELFSTLDPRLCFLADGLVKPTNSSLHFMV